MSTPAFKTITGQDWTRSLRDARGQPNHARLKLRAQLSPAAGRAAGERSAARMAGITPRLEAGGGENHLVRGVPHAAPRSQNANGGARVHFTPTPTKPAEGIATGRGVLNAA